MSFARYQRLTSNTSHTLPTTNTTQNTYPVAQQVPLSQQDTTGNVNGGQYNTSFPSDPTSPAAAHVHTEDKTEV